MKQERFEKVVESTLTKEEEMILFIIFLGMINLLCIGIFKIHPDGIGYFALLLGIGLSFMFLGIGFVAPFIWILCRKTYWRKIDE